MSSRRSVIVALAAGALAAPLLSFGQQKIYRIGFLVNDADPRKSSTFKALIGSLQELGWSEGRNIDIRIRSSGGSIEEFPQLAGELVRGNVDVIVTAGSPATRAAKVATHSIPIVFASAADPVGQKLVASLARPGANVTGVALAVQELGPKRLELLKEMLPRATRFVRLYQAASINPLQPSIIGEDDTAARRLGVSLQHVPVTDMAAVKAAFATAARSRIDAIVLTGAGLFVGQRDAIAKLALENRVPIMCTEGQFVEAGALASYGEDFPMRYRRVAILVDRILRGAKPANIPVEQFAVFEFVVNLRTAKALGTTIPDPILVQADRVIR